LLGFKGDWAPHEEEFNSILRTPEWAGKNVDRIVLPTAKRIKKFGSPAVTQVTWLSGRSQPSALIHDLR
jgi:hypothetical protein